MRAAVVGGAGYAGGELLRLLSDHPNVEVVQVTSERLAGKRVDLTHPPLRGRTDLRFTARESLETADVLFVALEHGESSKHIDHLRGREPTSGCAMRARIPRGTAGHTLGPHCSRERCTDLRSCTATACVTPRSSPPGDA
jgi:hypothetical protein